MSGPSRRSQRQGSLRKAVTWGEVDMNVERQPPAPRRKFECVEWQEEQTWARFYPQARSDATLAEELLTELERDELLRRRHRGLYLSCQRCVRLHERRQARHQQVGRVVRAGARAVFVTAPRAFFRGLRQVGQLLLACLPLDDVEDSRAPWQAQARRLLERDAYALGDQTLRVRARQAADKVRLEQRADESLDSPSGQRPPTAARAPTAAAAVSVASSASADPAMAKSAVS